MKIERVELFFISMPLVAPFTTSFGTQTDRDCLIVALHTEGLTGWGECVATNDPGYSYETAVTAWHILSDFLIPTILGQELTDPAQMRDWLRPVRGHPLAKAALDQAAWDLAAQRDGLSLAQMLARPYAKGARSRVPVGVSIGMQPTMAQTMEVIAGYLAEGYDRIKLKIKPGHDLQLAQLARQTFPTTRIMLDANSAYSLADLPLFRALDDLNLLMIEQPLDYEDIYEHSKLQAHIATPLCLDESIRSAADTRFALEIGACDVINVKPSRVGGWTEAREIHDLCWAMGVPVWVGGMLETGIGRAAQLALAALPGFTLPGDISATARYYEQDIATPFYLNAEDSTMTVPTGPGLGVEVDRARLTAVTRQTRTFSQQDA